MRRRRTKTLLQIVLCAALIAIPTLAQANSPELDRGYDDMYNRDFTAAHAIFNAWIESHPEDPLGPVSDAAAFLFAELDRLNIIEIELFQDKETFANQQPLKPSPTLRSDFDRRARQGEDLADAILTRSPQDGHALFTKMFLYGLRAGYVELIEKSDIKALHLTKKGAEYSAQTLQADPTLYDAHIVTGFENYLLGLKPPPVRWIARLMGGQTDKIKGISEITITAQQGHYLAPFAQILLAAAYLHEGKKAEAKPLLTTLAERFPKNPMYLRQLNRIH